MTRNSAAKTDYRMTKHLGVNLAEMNAPNCGAEPPSQAAMGARALAPVEWRCRGVKGYQFIQVLQ